jgi:LuxR family maltose regulon positive regulatory protein
MELVRPRLVRRLRDAVRNPVTVIIAPAGYGKTVLLDQLASEHVGMPLGRVTLQPDDDWPSAAVRIDAALPTSGESILVLEGVDAAPDKRLASELTSLIDRLPPAVHLVLVSRSSSTSVLRALQGRGDVVALTAADLAFTRAEAHRLVRAAAGAALDGPVLDRLQDKTQGWAVGLYVAAIGLRDAPDPDAYVEAFGGDERHVAAFVHEDVFEAQPAMIRRFLARTSVALRLSGPLCDRLTGDSDGASVLQRLERDGVFIHRVHGSRDVFVHHPLFRTFLRRELRRGEFGEETTLLVSAGAWYAETGEPEFAARMFVEAEAWDQLADLAETFGQRMYEGGRADEVLAWLDAIPPTRSAQAPVALRRALLQTMLGQSDRAAQIVHDLKLGGLSTGERAAADAIRATWAFFDAPPESTVQAADRALEAMEHIDLEELPNIFGITSPTSLAMMAATSRARALWYQGEVEEARRALSAGVKQRDVYASWFVHTVSTLAVLEAWDGNLRVGRAYGVRASALARRTGLLHHPAMLDARVALAHVSRERGNQARAFQLMEEAEAVAARSRRPYPAAIVAVERARWLLADGEAPEGLAALERYRAACEVPAPPFIEARLRAVEAWLLLALGDGDLAEALLTGDDDVPVVGDLEAAGVAAAIARRDLGTAAERLTSWKVDDAQQPGRRQRDLWSAVVEFEGGERSRAIQIVSGVVSMAEREGDVRLFLDGGRPVERLLKALVRAAPLPYAERVLGAANVAHDPAKGGVLGLSKRELEVARYLPTPLSSAEIAARLYISLNTLKTHLRTIYGKLGATNRREAIQRAEELGIA